MSRSFRKSAKAVSPVIATIIIVAVAIVMSIAVAYWMLGLATTFTRYEKLEFVVAYAEKTTETVDSFSVAFNVTLQIKNTGSSDATIQMILLNGKLDGQACVNVTDTAYEALSNSSLNIPVKAGQTVLLYVGLPNTYSSGQTVEIMVQSAAGNQYPKTVVLP
ncbi:MAG: archaellin/type IV pilin N-terminal domain-containing protein [Candidatus Bathyarchaeia archaeon]